MRQTRDPNRGTDVLWPLQVTHNPLLFPRMPEKRLQGTQEDLHTQQQDFRIRR